MSAAHERHDSGSYFQMPQNHCSPPDDYSERHKLNATNYQNNNKRHRVDKMQHSQSKVEEWLSSRPLICHTRLESGSLEMQQMDVEWA